MALFTRIMIAALLTVFATTSRIDAQGVAPVVSPAGIAYDSLHHVPLPNAFIVAIGLGKSATSDAAGRFRFDSLPVGMHTFVLQHDALDSLGLSGISVKLSIGSDRDTIHMSIPSFAKLWATACGINRAPRDSGFIFGSVRRAKGGQSVVGAEVQVQWLKVGFLKKVGVSQSQWGGSVHTDADGDYVVCGVPNDMAVRVRAHIDSAVTDTLDLITSSAGVRRLDLMIGDSAAASAIGVIQGSVRDAAGKPVAHATISGNNIPDVQSEEDGSFVVRSVPLGTRQLNAKAIGSLPTMVTVHVTSQDTAVAIFRLARVTVLDSVKVKALSIRQQFVGDLQARQHLGIGRFVDSTTVVKRNTIVGALLESPQLKVNKGGKILFYRGNDNCFPIVFIDRVEVDQEELKLLNLNNIGMLEVYSRPTAIPSEFIGRGGGPGCAIIVWTKRLFP